MDSIETPTVRFELGDDGIVRSFPLDNADPATVEVVTRDTDALRELLGASRHPIVLTLVGVPPPDGRVWSTLIRRLPEGLSAMAIVSTRKELMGQFPKAIGSLIVPVKIFSDPDEAAEWAVQFVDG